MESPLVYCPEDKDKARGFAFTIPFGLSSTFQSYSEDGWDIILGNLCLNGKKLKSGKLAQLFGKACSGSP